MILNLKNLNNHVPLVRTSLESQEILAEGSRLNTVLEVWYHKQLPNLLQKVGIVLPLTEH